MTESTKDAMTERIDAQIAALQVRVAVLTANFQEQIAALKQRLVAFDAQYAENRAGLVKAIEDARYWYGQSGVDVEAVEAGEATP